MQTFLPYPCFIESFACLDYRRLGKQRVEAKQILVALGVSVGDHKGNLLSKWRNHPAVKMWRGHEACLCVYASCACNEWRRRGYNDTLMLQFVESYMSLPKVKRRKPVWLGSESFHASHRSNLLRKSPDHYGVFGWLEPPNLEYVWPA